eukprot:TRINITY_DN3741_c0_g1_i3.p1 TRINITY_DN3741_c0_g1~~TRINITY_DN3741_c0_g1_i3.p1  ORF type:complete len:603 (-),score=169.42 TRINITY_DN3741_c0_g1_i3:87-1895(-)
MSFKNMCFQQPELTACLAELSSTVAELASRHYDLPSPRLAWPELQALPPSHEQHKPARCDAMQLSWRQNADSRAELQTAEPARCDAAEAEQAVEGSQLQAIIERQVRALQDVTNIADKRDGQDKDDMDLAVFRGVSFNKHKRASPCAQCGGLFFPMSLKIHQERCLARPPSSPPSPAPAAAAAQQNQPAAYAACAAEDCLARPSPAPAAGARQWKQPAPRAARAAEDRCSAKSPPPSVPAAAAGQRNQPAPVAACAAEACLARPRPSSPPVLAAGAQQRKQPARQAAWAAEDHCSARASSAPPAPEAAEQKNQTAPRIACAAEDWLARPALADRAEQQNQPASRTACAAEEGDDAEQTWRYTCPPPSPADSESLYRLTSCAEIRHATVHKSSPSRASKQRSVGRSQSVSSQASLAPTTSTSSRRKNASKQPRSNMGQHAGAAERKATNQEAVHRSLPQASCEQEQDEPCEGEEAWLSKEQQQQQPAASDDALQTPQALQSQWALDACVEPRPCDTIRRDEHAWLSPAKQAAPKKRLERIPRSWQVLSRVQLQEGGEEDCLQVPPGVVSVAVTKPRPRAGGGAPRGSSSRRRQHFAGTTPSFR